MPAKIGLPVKPRVLLLGSDSMLESDLVAALRTEICEVLLAADCRQALDLTRTGHVDVLVLDFDSHSREFSQLASKPSFAESRCRTLVLADSLEQLTLASETRADGVLMKPLDPNQLRTVIHNLLADTRTQALTERWIPDTAPFPEALPSKRDWGINEEKKASFAMKINTTFLLLGLVPLLASCASQPIALAPVGPGPFVNGASSNRKGDLQVYTETEEYYEDEMSYFPHTDYQIYTADGKHLKRVWNHQNHEDENPAVVTLPPGEYVVKAWAEFYGLVTVPVVIKPDETTRVILQPGWKPGKTVAKSDLVQVPNGYFVGWRADLPSNQ